ncbi:type II secretion system F family protein [Gordonia sp. ABSL1-1]|uniref:type II secretion system F family protein n=1 Tax=Gordonia sp. ABSL1-1 TaxID=3053923 RepID=UPI0025727AB2|nr:type II secretion system F family protein [Gordonia sp. ABSL1-1]MDL9937524.1 type II secretion system F family protein [Gordonia sp. ABSL1-1]
MNGSAAVSIAVILAAIAVLVWTPGPPPAGRVLAGSTRRRRSEPRWLRRSRPDDPFAVAAAFELFAVCLRSGMPVGTAAATVAGAAPASLAAPLNRVAELLGLGADAERAWSAVDDAADRGGRRGSRPTHSHLQALSAMARRSARSGSALAAGLDELAADIRRKAADRGVAAAERAGVAISGPLGLCFLPAFVCLGIVPVVVGLASGVLSG